MVVLPAPEHSVPSNHVNRLLTFILREHFVEPLSAPLSMIQQQSAWSLSGEVALLVGGLPPSCRWDARVTCRTCQSAVWACFAVAVNAFLIRRVHFLFFLIIPPISTPGGVFILTVLVLVLLFFLSKRCKYSCQPQFHMSGATNLRTKQGLPSVHVLFSLPKLL